MAAAIGVNIAKSADAHELSGIVFGRVIENAPLGTRLQRGMLFRRDGIVGPPGQPGRERDEGIDNFRNSTIIEL